MTVPELIETYKSGNTPERTTQPLVIDNDDTHVYQEYYELDAAGTPVDEDSECVFRMHPGELLEQLLDYVGIPHEPA